MEPFFTEILQVLNQGQRGALATIVRCKGSVPRKEGAHLFLAETGRAIGTIGGGGLEAEVLEIARACLRSTRGYLRSFTLVEGDDPSDMVCGGNVSILVEPVTREDGPIFASIAKALETHASCCFVRLFRRGAGQDDSPLACGPKGAVTMNGTHLFTEPLGNPLKDRLVTWANVLLEEGTPVIRILESEIRDITPPPEWNLAIFESLHVSLRLVIFGGGHLSKALCAMAALCNFRVEVIDDREEFARKERFPEAARAFHIPGYRHLADLISFDSHTYVVIATRGHRYDEVVLSQVVDYDLPYIGMVGSRQKNAIVFERLRERGIPQARLEKVHAPIGLPIHSETPEEIAVSILAELIQSKAQQKSKSPEGS